MSVDEESIGKIIVENLLTISNNNGTFLMHLQDEDYILEMKREDGSIVKVYM